MLAKPRPGNSQLLFSQRLLLCSALQSLWLCLLPEPFSPQLEGKVIDVLRFKSQQYTVCSVSTDNAKLRDAGSH